jgi:kumamolisin
MPTPKKQLPLAGSDRSPMPGAREVGPANPGETLEVTVRLCSRAGQQPIFNPETASQLPSQRPILSREDFEKTHGADPASIARVEKFAREHRLKVVDTSAARRTVVLSGDVAAMSAAFGVELKEYEHPGGKYRGRTGAVHIPSDLQDVVEGVFGLDNRPQAKPHFRRRRSQPGVHAQSAGISYTPPQLAGLYDFPTGLDGSGQAIALIELGGGYKPADLSAYFNQLNLSKHPSVSSVSVNQAKNQPTGDANGPDGEVMLDIEVAGSIAPGAKIVVYFAPNTDAGFLNAITTAVHDKTHKPAIISISWGGPESSWTSQAMTAMDEAFQAAAAVGVTVCVAAGDDGSTDGVTDGLNHVDFPASSPYALACGGTRLQSSGTTIASEKVWNELPNEGATGGGISDFFPLPAWQSGAHIPPSANPGKHVGRGVPDVGGNADPETGYVTRVDGQPDVIGGTSAVAPLWAGLVALINQSLGKPAGYLNPVLYKSTDPEADFNDITSGNNGAYKAKKSWDPCTGLGTPKGSKIAVALGAPLSAKAKRTASE